MLRFIGSARFPKEYIPKCRSPSRCLKGGNNVHTSQTPFELRHTIRIRARLQMCRYSRKKDTGFSPCVWQFHSAVPIPRISYAVFCLKKKTCRRASGKEWNDGDKTHWLRAVQQGP